MQRQLCILAILFVAFPSAAMAGPCDAHYRFDGNLQDLGGQGYHGQMIAANGEVATPQFEESAAGSALKLDGTTAMRIMLDVSPDLCPKMTVVAWIRIEPLPNQAIFGNNGGVQLLASGSSYYLRVAGRDLTSSAAIFPNAQWQFIAATWDNEARTYRLHWNARHDNASFADREPKPGYPAVWVGALNDKLHAAAKDVLVDDLRFIGRSLSIDEVNELRTAGPSRQAAADPAAGTAGTTCAAHRDCGTGAYCAVNGMCYPDDQLPMPEDPGRTLTELQEQMAARNADVIGPVDTNRPPDLTAPGRTLEDMQDQSAGQYADVVGDFENDVSPLRPGEQSSGDVSTGGASGGDVVSGGGSGGTTGGKGSTSVADYLAELPMHTVALGETLECKSPVQRLADLATGFRDAMVEIVSSTACRLAEKPLASLAVSAGVEDPAVYETPEFQNRVVAEIFDSCGAAVEDMGGLPDAMLGFWNDQIANNNWSTLGPRHIVFGKTETGNIISPGDRMFLSTSPWVEDADPHVTLEEFSGKARMQVTICATEALTGYSRVLHRFILNDNQDERDNEKQFFVYTLPARHSYISIFLDGRSTPDRHFRYKLTVGD